jgi:hypothetical protein
VGVKGGAYEIHIEELELDGFALNDRHHVAEDLRTELARILTDEAITERLARGDVPGSPDAREVQAASPVSVEAVGRTLGQTVAAAVIRGPRNS